MERDGDPPCSSCPKGEMDLEGKLDLHPRNRKAFQFWQSLKVMHGAQLVPDHLQNCDVFSRVMVTIDRVVEQSRQRVIERMMDKDKGEGE